MNSLPRQVAAFLRANFPGERDSTNLVYTTLARWQRPIPILPPERRRPRRQQARETTGPRTNREPNGKSQVAAPGRAPTPGGAPPSPAAASQGDDRAKDKPGAQWEVAGCRTRARAHSPRSRSGRGLCQWAQISFCTTPPRFPREIRLSLVPSTTVPCPFRGGTGLVPTWSAPIPIRFRLSRRDFLRIAQGFNLGGPARQTHLSPEGTAETQRPSSGQHQNPSCRVQKLICAPVSDVH